MLCHRFLVQHKQQQHLSLCLFARRHLSSVTRHSQQSVQWLELLYDQYLSEEEERRSQCEMQLEHIHRCFGSSWEGINAVETALSTAIAVHSVFNLPPKLGKPTEAEAHHKNRYKTYGYALAELLSRPNLSECFSGDVTRTSIPFQVAVLDNALWCYAAVPSFLTVHPMKEGEIEYKESAARVTCLAERPVHTASGFQEMTVREDNEEGTIKVAFSLSKEVK
ncbi:hypothetical protein AGDE_15252 [Angomonas deanei]|uniref:Uncharacterized protein n=1 Tax=Angomonas deanei TaxID=59799 RepID=A0A7G2CBZ5_9TRYP|nr:hypothetical protein AGDE_15252 [Angomonas deanei]CAD2217328.1 hypothetical protein, conserved [Angomonas deanei]|eukprot:EPY19413.1 hypothetical protein AGDE_15252 [Angomonas deanei]